MLLTDYHIHSNCSSDGNNTMLEMVMASHEKGVSHLCFTDHCDLDHYSTGVPDAFPYAHRARVLEMYNKTMKKLPPNIKVYLGIELGEMNHDPTQAATIAALPELDFVLGSLHNLRNTRDFYETTFTDEAMAEDVLDKYVDELVEFSTLTTFDVIAHIGYPVRYFIRDGLKATLNLKTHGDRLEQMLKNLIANGKGIEINCSGFRNNLINGPIPMVDILRLYKQLGGEIITVGSDAHRTSQAGVGLAEGFDILRDLGYKYVAIYDKHQPEFLKI